jgi:hypothetical protein
MDSGIHVRIKLSALWASVMFLYLYADYFELYQPGKLHDMLQGQLAIGPVTQTVLLVLSAMMAIPSLMIFLSIALTPLLSRWLNVVFGVLYTAIAAMTMLGSWWYYRFFNVVEIVLTALVVWYAWTWPKAETATS